MLITAPGFSLSDEGTYVDDLDAEAQRALRIGDFARARHFEAERDRLLAERMYHV